jgi:CDP-glucose 4,6-dehydratase
MKAFMNNQKVVIRNPNSIRPWQHVLEPLCGYLTLAENLWESGIEYADGWNFGPSENDAKKVSWVVEQLAKLWGADTEWSELPQPYPNEANYLKLDCSKARQKLAWAPQLDLNTSLEWVVEWYKGFNCNMNVKELTINQILKYQNLLNT